MARVIGEAFWKKVDKNGPIPTYAPQLGPCWLWIASLMHQGYGQFGVGTVGVDRIVRRAHVIAYEQVVGKVPIGLELDHLCRVRACVNPTHLEPVTHAENLARGYWAMKTHCPSGHPYNDENTRWVVSNIRGRHRKCRACLAGQNQRAYLKRKNAMARINYKLTHLIYVDPDAAKKELLEALRAEKMHMGKTAASIGCTHGTLLGWIEKLDTLGKNMTDAVLKLKVKALKEGWHWVNTGNPNGQGRPKLSMAEKKRRAEARAAMTPAQKRAATAKRADKRLKAA